MKNRFKKLMGLGILAAVVIAAVPAVDVAAVGEANGSAGHEHRWVIFPVGRTVKGFCNKKVNCKYRGMSNALKITFNVSDEYYSGKPYSGLIIDGIDEWLAAGLPQDIYIYTDNKQIQYKPSNPPVAVGRYDLNWKAPRSLARPAMAYIKWKYMASFNILPPENSVQNGNTQGNTVNDSQNSNIPVGNEPASQSSTPEGNEPTSQSSDIPQGNEPTKPAFENKDCMDKVKDMAGAEINNQ